MQHKNYFKKSSWWFDVVRWIKFILVFSAIAVPERILAQELVEINTSVRALGMGNAYTGIVNDAYAMFYNPAALNKVHGVNWRIMNPYLGVNNPSLVGPAQSLASASSQAQMAQALHGFFGQPIWLGFGGHSAFTVPNFGIAAYQGASMGALLSNPAYPNFDVNFYSDLGLATGFSAAIMPGFSVGFTAKRIIRTGAAFPIGLSSIANLSSSSFLSSLSNMGTGYGLDMGILFAPPAPIKPTFTFVWKDLGVTRFTQDSGVAPPPQSRDEMIVGFGCEIDASILKIRPAFDFAYLNWYDQVLAKKTHFGIEFSLPLIDLRAGLNQGYYTLGAGLDLWFMRLDVATYGVELGAYAGQQQDRRYVAQLSFELGFDPDFSFLKGGDGNGSGKHLKQRR